MAKKKANARQKTQKNRQPQGQGRMVRSPAAGRIQALLDNNARSWARLLEDPCNAPLVYPCFSTGGGGTVLMRLEYDTILWSGATDTAGVYAWIPGAALSIINGTTLTSDTTTSTYSGANGPGSQWFPTNASSVRAVAACMQVMYPGTELNRSGIVAIGCVPADTFVSFIATAGGGANNATSAAAARQSLVHAERMPTGVVEARWFPGENDQGSINGTLPTAYASVCPGRNGILVSASGFPVSTGIRVRAVGVYEVSLYSSSTLGSVQTPAPPVSVNNAAQVIKTLFDRDPQWWLTSAQKAGRALSNAISYAGMGAKAAGTVVNGLALIAA
jgi:hypothetical protein